MSANVEERHREEAAELVGHQYFVDGDRRMLKGAECVSTIAQALAEAEERGEKRGFEAGKQYAIDNQLGRPDRPIGA